MANRFQRGDLCPVQFVPAGAAGVTLAIKGWNGDFDVLTFDVTNTSHGGHTARIAGKNDGKGNVTASLDLDQLPSALNVSVIEGNTGILLKFISPRTAIQVPIIIKKVHWESAIEQEVKWNFDWEFNTLAGLYVLPAAA